MRKASRKLSIFLLVGLMLAPGCLPADGVATAEHPAGFFSGVWHGWVAPLSLILGALNGKTRVYESLNTGWGYDFGFYIAVIGGFGGLALVRRKRRERAANRG